MVKRLVKHGNSLALLIDRGVLDLLKIDAETPLSITTNGQSLIVTPADEARQRTFKLAVAEGNRRYGRMLKRLAD